MSTTLVLGPVLPEIMLALGALALTMLGAYGGKRAEGLVTELAILVLGLAAITILTHPGGQGVFFGGAYVNDAFSRFMKALATFGSLVTLLLSIDFMRRARVGGFEFPVLVLLSTLGMMMLISAHDLIALYLGLELMSLSLYVVAAYDRDNAKATEAGLKYFVLGALSSGMLLYGASLLYGFSGTVNFSGIAEAIHGHATPGLVFGLVFLMAGMAFKISAVPFHMWTPDVYEGAPTPVTAFFAAGPKVAAMALMVRVIMTAFPGIVPEWRQIVIFIAIASMALGSFAAIGQANIKRLMAYSSIGHMGFALVGLAAGSKAGVQGVIIYMAIYLAMTLGTLAAIISMSRDGKNVETIADLSGLGTTNRAMAFFLAMLMFSLAGIPPLAGFFAKFYVFSAAVEAHLYWLAVIGVVLSCVAAFYYLRIVKVMYFDAPAPAFDRPQWMVNGVLVVMTLFITLFPLYPAPLVKSALAAATSLF